MTTLVGEVMVSFMEVFDEESASAEGRLLSVPLINIGQHWSTLVNINIG